jgi:hypothetical protein
VSGVRVLVIEDHEDLAGVLARTTVRKPRRKQREPDPIQTLIGSGYRIAP